MVIRYASRELKTAGPNAGRQTMGQREEMVSCSLVPGNLAQAIQKPGLYFQGCGSNLHPELVRSLVLSEPPLLRLLPELEGGKAIFNEFMSKVWEPATRGFLEGPEAVVKAAVDGFGELGYSGSDKKMTFETLEPVVRSFLLDNAPEWRALTSSRDPFPDLPPNAVAHIKVPTLLLSGQRSMTLNGLVDRQLEKLLPQGERIIISNATHEMWNEYPEECRKEVLAFIGKHYHRLQ